jgi:hypothetical protein
MLREKKEKIISIFHIIFSIATALVYIGGCVLAYLFKWNFWQWAWCVIITFLLFFLVLGTQSKKGG